MTTDMDNLGVTIKLEPEVAAELRKRRVSTDEEDWNHVYPLPRNDKNTSTNNIQPKSENHIEKDPIVPVVLVDVQRIAGYLPSSEDEQQTLQNTLLQAILQEHANWQDGVTQLVQSQLALYSHTGADLTDYLVLHYPEYIRDAHGTPRHVESMWHRLWPPTPHHLPFVTKILTLLVECQQPLEWKDGMRSWIVEEILVTEQNYLLSQAHEQWKRTRHAKLPQLYDIREAIVQKYEMGKERVEMLEQERERKVEEHLDGETWEQWPINGTSYLWSNDDNSGSNDDQPLMEENENYHTSLDHLQSQSLRDALTTPELTKAQATTYALQQQLQKVDDLLESLQDEEWQEEEGNDTDLTAVETRAMDDEGLSLLDQILAMILGSSPQLDDDTIRKTHRSIISEWKEYFGRLPPKACLEEETKEHKQSPCDQEHSKEELKAKLGICDYETEDWEKDDNDDKQQQPQLLLSNPVEMTEPAAKMGLRPGGRIS